VYYTPSSILSIVNKIKGVPGFGHQSVNWIPNPPLGLAVVIFKLLSYFVVIGVKLADIA